MEQLFPRRIKDPHRDHERELMDRGKLLAYLFAHHDKMLARFDPKDFVIEPHEYRGTIRHLICRPDQRWRINKFKEIYRQSNDGEISIADAHRQIGLLLGYTDDEVEWFVRMRGNENLA